jgi:hypothetical protein
MFSTNRKDGQMNNQRKIMWNGTVRALTFKEQLQAAEWAD